MDRTNFEAERVMAEIDKLKDVTASDDWDSHGAQVVSLHQQEQAKECVRAVYRAAGNMLARPLVSPIADPGVALIWRGKARGEVDAHFTPRGATYVVLGSDRKLVKQGQITSYERFATEVLTRYLTQ
jgi:hypothetical protein